MIMKKLLSVFLCIVTVLAVFGGCAPAQQPGESTAETAAPQAAQELKIGFGQVDITPTESVPLAGDGSLRLSDAVVDPLYATCIAITDGTGNTVLIYELDILNITDIAVMARSKIAKKTGVNGMQIILAATHNHSGPKQTEVDNPAIEKYNENFDDLLVQAAEMALADQKPVTKMYTARTYPLGLNFVRHHILADGSKTGWAAPAVKSAVAHVADPDNEMQLVKIAREGGKDIILMNWQGHPDATRVGNLQIRSDVDIVRREMEAKLDCHFVYLLGASGNMNTYSYIKSENITKDYIERGKALATYAIEAVPKFAEAKIGNIQFLYSDFKAGSLNNESAKMSIPIYALSIGDLAFSTAPYEMFKEMGEYIKKESPFAMTFVVTCSNGSLSYIPVDYSFDYDTYEVTMTKFARGTAEKAAEEHVRILREIYNAN